MRRTIAALFFVALGAALLADQPERGDKKSDEIVLGGLFNLKGHQAVLDVPSSKGAQLAVDEINRRGGLLGQRVRLVIEDGKSSPRKLAAGTDKILKANPAVTAFLGLSDTDMVLGAAPLAARAGRMFLTSGATSPKLPGQVPKYLFLACFGDNVQAAAAAEFAFNNLSARSAAVLYDSTDTYTTLLHGYFETRFRGLGGKIQSIEAYTPGKLDAPISRLEKADVVFLSAHTPDDAADATRLLRAAGFDVPIIGGDGFDAEDDWAAHTDLDNIYFTTHVYLESDHPDPAIRAFRAKYSAAYSDTPTAFSALGYDAVNLLAEAIQRARSAEPDAVLASLAGMSNFEAVTGNVSFEGSRIPRKSVSIIEVRSGKYKLANQLMPQSVPAP